MCPFIKCCVLAFIALNIFRKNCFPQRNQVLGMDLDARSRHYPNLCRYNRLLITRFLFHPIHSSFSRSPRRRISSSSSASVRGGSARGLRNSGGRSSLNGIRLIKASYMHSHSQHGSLNFHQILRSSCSRYPGLHVVKISK